MTFPFSLMKAVLPRKIWIKRVSLALPPLSICVVGWLVVLRLNVPVNNFSVMSGRSHRFLGN